MNQFKLSICLPTYNQASELERLLNSVTPQMTPDVEIVIRDDSTNDKTEHLVQRFSKKIPIRYFRGEKEGIDRAIVFLTKEARGDFVWWLGDEDVLPNGVKQILNVINRYKEVTFIWANFYISGTRKFTIDFPENRFFTDRNEILEKAVVGLGFISATIFKRKLVLTGIEASKKYLGSEFVNLYLILHVLAQPGKYYFVRGPVIVNYPATSEEIKSIVVKRGEIRNRAFEVFGINFTDILKKFEGPFSPAAVRRTITKSFGQTWRGILVGWIGGWDTPKGKRWRMFKLFWSYPECWIALLAFLMPLWFNKFLYKVYKIFFSHRKWRFGSGK